MSAPRAAAQLFRMPLPLGYSFRPLLRGRGRLAGTAQRAIPTIALSRYDAGTTDAPTAAHHSSASDMRPHWICNTLTGPSDQARPGSTLKTIYSLVFIELCLLRVIRNRSC